MLSYFYDFIFGATFNPVADLAKVRNVIPVPCTQCSATELRILRDAHIKSGGAHWLYTIPSNCKCGRCDAAHRRWKNRFEQAYYSCALIALYFAWHGEFWIGIAFAFVAKIFRDKWLKPAIVEVTVPIPVSTVGIVERAIHGASTAEKGSDGKAHGAFICHLANLDVDEVLKQSLCAWAPAAIGGYMCSIGGVRRSLSMAKPLVSPESPQGFSLPKYKDVLCGECEKNMNKPADVANPKDCSPQPNIDPPSENPLFKGNPDLEDGAAMPGTQLEGNEYGEEDRIVGSDVAEQLAGKPEPKLLAYPIGPDLIPTEVFDGTASNLQAGMAKRVKPLPFKADKHIVRSIEKVVSALILEVFNAESIRQWRVDNPEFFEMGSKKWSAARFRNAYYCALSNVKNEIKQEFQIKVNEALPANEKAPRPIIQTGDEGQMAMLLPVKLFESLLFKHFKKASIKGMAKSEAMAHFVQHMGIKTETGKKVNTNCIEGDGSAWDACCNITIRKMTENRILDHIVEVLGEDKDVPRGWMQECLADMEKEFLRGKAKVGDGRVGKIRSKIKVKIESIRQSGHRGTSAFNWLINYVGWMVVMCAHPEKMVRLTRSGKLQDNFISRFDGKEYILRYKFEGDDSALSTTMDVKPHAEEIERIWTSMGFRMKLVFGSNKLTFTGFNFLCDEKGPTGTFCPEVPRNIASSSWTTSNLVKQKPHMVHQVGAAAMLARAENFHMCGAFSAYFAQLGLAHTRACGDFEIGDDRAVELGINPVESVIDRLHELSAQARPMTKDMRKLMQADFGGISHEQECNMLACNFGDDPLNRSEAMRVLPPQVWHPSQFKNARRKPI